MFNNIVEQFYYKLCVLMSVACDNTCCAFIVLWYTTYDIVKPGSNSVLFIKCQSKLCRNSYDISSYLIFNLWYLCRVANYCRFRRSLSFEYCARWGSQQNNCFQIIVYDTSAYFCTIYFILISQFSKIRTLLTMYSYKQFMSGNSKKYCTY